MPLASGQRIDAGSHSAYVIDAIEESSPYGTRYSARKTFFNFRYDDQTWYEAAEDEWVRVQIRSSGQGSGSNPDDARLLRQLLEYEAGAILGKYPGWFPEPLDWLSHEGQQLLVTSVPHGVSLAQWRTGPAFSVSRAVRAAGEILNMLEVLHRNEHVVGAIAPDDFIIDSAGRLCFLGTDRVLPVDRVAGYRRVHPPERYRDNCAAPEVRAAGARFDQRSDLYSWARLFLALLNVPNESEAPGSQQANGHVDRCRVDVAAGIDFALRDIARVSPHVLAAFSPAANRRSSLPDVAGWSIAIAACLCLDPSGRPASVESFRRLATSRSPLASLGRLRAR